MLKLKLDKATHATLPADIQKEYKADGEGFILDTDVIYEDVTGLKNSLLQERTAHKTTKAEKTALEGTVKDLETRAGSATDLEKQWQKKLEDAATKAETDKKTLTGQIQSLLVDNVAAQLAAEISTSPTLMTPVIKSRLVAEEVDGKYVTRVLTPDGKPSVTSLKELGEEFRANKEFSPIITASKASGGGANGGKGPVGDKPFSTWSEAEKTALFKSDRPKFDRLNAESQTKSAPASGAK